MSTKAESDLTYILTIPIGDRNEDFKFVVTKDGLQMDEGETIPWDWIRATYTKAVLDPQGDIRKHAFDPLKLPA